MSKAVAVPSAFRGAFAQLHAAAIEEADGLDDFGPSDYAQPLEVLLDAIESDSPLTEQGRWLAWNDLVEGLTARLFATKGLAETPERGTVKAPIFIIGHPRTGTTALHKLLSVDPQFQGLDRWLTDFPMPRPDRGTWDANPLFKRVLARLARRYNTVEDMKRIHLEAAEEVDECLQILRMSFASIRFGSILTIPSYDRWLNSVDQRQIHKWYGDVVAMIGAGDSRRWLLKNPSHILHLPELVEAFPDAIFIQTHRKLTAAVPSFSSMLYIYRQGHEGDAADPKVVANRELALWGNGCQKGLIARRSLSNRCIDIWHAEFNAHPIETVKDIYRRLNLELADEVEQAMKKRLVDDPERRLGAHRYDLETYGLTETRIRDAFGNYAVEFGV